MSAAPALESKQPTSHNIDKAALLPHVEIFVAHARQDVHAEYYFDSLKQRGAYKKVLQPFDVALLRRHLDGGPYLGAYLIDAGSDVTRIGGLDLDDHDGTSNWDAMSEVAARLCDIGKKLGLEAWPVRSGGGKGIHLLYRWDNDQKGAGVRDVLQTLIAIAGLKEGTEGIAKGEVEIFPKQGEVAAGGFGNLIAVPFGRVSSVPLDADLQPTPVPMTWISSAPVPTLQPAQVKQPASNADPDTVREALKTLASDDYGEWIRIGLALKNSFGDAGFDTWDEWSHSSKKYPGQGTAKTLWDTFKPRQDGVTVGTVFHLAREAGWQGQVLGATAASDDPAMALREMNELHAVIENYGNKTRVMTERPSPFFQGFDDFRNIYMNKSVQAGTDKGGEPIMVARGKWWLGHALRRQYKRVEFMPGQESPEGVFNLWRGFPVAPMPGTCDLFLALLRDTICAGCDTYCEWLLDWMAHAIQHPQEPGEVAVVLRGGQGIGKSFLAEHFGELFGRHFVPLTDPKHVVGNFNQILHDALFVFADEAFAANDKRAEGVLKGLVTQSHITIESKGVDAFKARRFFRMLLASNNSWVVPADVDDRRFLVLDVAAAHKYDTVYFAAIDAEWRSGGREALMHALLNRDITHFDHRRRPDTPALMDQKVHTLRGASRVMYEMLASGDAPVGAVDGHRIFVATRDLHRDVSIKCSETAVGLSLAKAAEHKKAQRELCDGKRKKGFWLPRLSDARRQWADLSELGGVRWPSDDGEWTASVSPSAEDEEPPF